LGWFGLLLYPRSWWIFGPGVALGFALSVWLCGVGAMQLHQKDPGSVVLDEITAIPLCFVSAIWIVLHRHQPWPGPDWFFSAAHGAETAGIFILFRIFDILKPWPVRQSQNLYGGLGITIDDFLAAVYVNLVVLVISRFVQ
jgi:phosphatidylglycerophosphatase A